MYAFIDDICSNELHSIPHNNPSIENTQQPIDKYNKMTPNFSCIFCMKNKGIINKRNINMHLVTADNI